MAVNMADISYESTRYLLQAGHRRIAFISTLKTEAPYLPGMQLDSSQIADRLDGMRQAFQEQGLALPRGPRPAQRRRRRIHPAALPAMCSACPNPATAVVASDGLIALSIVEAIQELGLTIPADVSFLMYDDFAWTRLTTPPLTVIAQPVYNMGVAAAEALIRQIEGRKPSPTPPAFTARLIRRGSVGAPRAAKVST